MKKTVTILLTAALVQFAAVNGKIYGATMGNIDEKQVKGTIEACKAKFGTDKDFKDRL